MELNIESERTEDGIAIITVDGELDLYTAPHLKENLLAALEDDVTKIAIDMTGVHFIDSSALGVLMSTGSFRSPGLTPYSISIRAGKTHSDPSLNRTGSIEGAVGHTFSRLCQAGSRHYPGPDRS
jgi:anti-anti-sigma regulatory factor